MLKLEKATFLGSSAHSYHAEGIAVTETVYHEKVFEGWHCHENHHITFVMSGGNLEQRRCHEIAAFPGAVLSYNSGELHRNTHTQHPSRNINVEIEDSFLAAHEVSFHVQPNEPGLKAALIRIWRESKINDACALPSIQMLVLQLLSAPPAGSTPAWAGVLRSLLNDCWSETFSLQQLSRILHVHPVTISKHFPRYFSCTLGEYMRKVKIDRALSLMRQPDRPLTDIAYECGFSDQSHFTRTFKAFTGMLPGQYRKC